MSLPQFWHTYITSLHTYKIPEGFPWASQSPFSLFKPGQTMASYSSRPSSKPPVNGSIWVPQTLHSACVTAIILESCTFLSSLPPRQDVTTLKVGTGPQWLHHPQHCPAQGQNPLHSCAHVWCYPLRRAMAQRKLSPRERLWVLQVAELERKTCPRSLEFRLFHHEPQMPGRKLQDLVCAVLGFSLALVWSLLTRHALVFSFRL